MRARATQTNEAGRCAVLLPVLAALPQPLALLEVGASAGLCLYPDRYAYRYGDQVLGAGEPVLDCAATGVAPPPARPEVVWRAGLDLNPLDVTDPADVAWLDALIWPEHPTAGPGCAPPRPSPPPTRRCWCAATWSTTCPRWPRRRRPARRWWCSTPRCSTRCRNRGGRRSPRWSRAARPLDRRSRRRTCCATTTCRRRPATRPQRARPGRQAARLDPRPRPGPQLVRRLKRPRRA